MNVQPADIQVMKREMCHAAKRKRKDSVSLYYLDGYFIVVPLILILFYSFTEGDIHNLKDLKFSVSSYKKVLEPIYLKVIETLSFWPAFQH